jgi:uncharacterized protein with PIN domain
MKLVTLQRQAPVAPDADRCHLCHSTIRNTHQDHLLLGQPGTAAVRAAICPSCGQVLTRLVDWCGAELTLLVQGRRGGRV